jgi:hypothetical protein
MQDEAGTVLVILPDLPPSGRAEPRLAADRSGLGLPFCGAALEIDHDRLAAFMTERNAPGAAFTVRLSPRPNRGITTRRTR